MGKIKQSVREKSIKNAFVSYILICILSALLLSLLLSELCQSGQEQFYKKYQSEYEDSAHYIEMESWEVVPAMAY